MLISEFIATKSSEVGLSWFDFYSIGHICMGIGIFLFFSLFYTIPMAKEDDLSQVKLHIWTVWVITIICGIAWEYIENVYFIEWGLKFEGRKDSMENMVTDVLLVAVGGFGSWMLAHLVFATQKNHWIYLTR